MTRLLALMITLVCTAPEGAAMALTPAEESVARQTAALYRAAADDVAQLSGRAVQELAVNPDRAASQWRQTRAAILARQIDQRLASLDSQTRTVLAGSESAVREAIARGEREMRELGIDEADRSDAVQRVGLISVIDNDAVEAIARDTVARMQQRSGADLVAAARTHGENAKTLFRSMAESQANRIQAGGFGTAELNVNRAVARGLITGDPVATDRAIRELFRDPANPTRESARKLGGRLIEVGNATMTVRDYADVVARTRTREATETAHRERLLSGGIRLGQIFGSNSANFCTAFVGLVVSLTGSDETIDGVTYPARERLPNGGPPFHPRCSKNTVAFDPDLASSKRLALVAPAQRRFERRSELGRLTEPFRG